MAQQDDLLEQINTILDDEVHRTCDYNTYVELNHLVMTLYDLIEFNNELNRLSGDRANDQ